MANPLLAIRYPATGESIPPERSSNPHDPIRPVQIYRQLGITTAQTVTKDTADIVGAVGKVLVRSAGFDLKSFAPATYQSLGQGAGCPLNLLHVLSHGVALGKADDPEGTGQGALDSTAGIGHLVWGGRIEV
jgi:hypothetical protein